MKMWLFPGLSILTVVALVGVLVLMAFDPNARMELWLGLLSWAVVLTLYFVPRWWRGSVKDQGVAAPSGKANSGPRAGEQKRLCE